MSLLDEYEESFFYDKKKLKENKCSLDTTKRVGELSGGIIGSVLAVLIIIVTRIDLLSSALLGLLFCALTYKFEWPLYIYLISGIAIVCVSILLQHKIKIFRFIYGLFTCVSVSLLVPIIIGYDSDAKMYGIMLVSFICTAVWGFFSWKDY